VNVVMVSEFPEEGRDPKGGVETSALRLVCALAEAGTSVSVVAPAGPEITESVHERHDATIVHVGRGDRFSLLRSVRPWRRSAARAISGLEPDLVHGQALLIGGLPACDVRARPRVVTAHGDPRRDTLADFPGLAGTVRAELCHRLSRQVVRRADAIVDVHPDWRVNLPFAPGRLEHIPNIVDQCFFDADAKPEPGRVLFCGGPSRRKGWDVLLAAWPAVKRELAGATLRASGWPASAVEGGESEPDAEITLLPGLPPVSVAAEMAKASLVVIPARYEVAPIVVSEAWAVGTPIVSTTAGGLATFAHGAAVLVQPEDPGELASAIVRVLAGDGETPALVAEGRRRAQRQTAASVAEAHRSLYEELLAGHS
jgi:glycosyltransferase involved in cell wall biosynthesis